MKYRLFVIATFGLIIIIEATGIAADDEKVSIWRQIPNAVHAAFQRAFPNARQAGYFEEIRAGKTIYEIEFTEYGKARAAFYTDQGTLLETEVVIDPTELPASITKAITQAHPTALLKRAEAIAKPDETVSGYEVDVMEGDHTIELGLDSGGKITKTAMARAYTSRIKLPVDQNAMGR